MILQRSDKMFSVNIFKFNFNNSVVLQFNCGTSSTLTEKALLSRVAESEVKYPTPSPTPTFPKFPTPDSDSGFPNFQTPTFPQFPTRLLNIMGMKFGCSMEIVVHSKKLLFLQKFQKKLNHFNRNSHFRSVI